MNSWNEIPHEERERMMKPLGDLNAAFRPLAETLRFEDEPAAIFDASDEAE